MRSDCPAGRNSMGAVSLPPAAARAIDVGDTRAIGRLRAHRRSPARERSGQAEESGKRRIGFEQAPVGIGERDADRRVPEKRYRRCSRRFATGRCAALRALLPPAKGAARTTMPSGRHAADGRPPRYRHRPSSQLLRALRRQPRCGSGGRAWQRMIRRQAPARAAGPVRRPWHPPFGDRHRCNREPRRLLPVTTQATLARAAASATRRASSEPPRSRGQTA